MVSLAERVLLAVVECLEADDARVERRSGARSFMIERSLDRAFHVFGGHFFAVVKERSLAELERNPPPISGDVEPFGEQRNDVASAVVIGELRENELLDRGGGRVERKPGIEVADVAVIA